MDKNKLVNDDNGCCLLCLELKREIVDAIFINSAQYNTLNIKLLIEKYFWTMKHITPSSWLCVNCWTELYDFHNFYMRIKKAHENLNLHCQKTDKNAAVKINTAITESPIPNLLDCTVNEINDNFTSTAHNNGSESHMIEFKENSNDLILDSESNEIVSNAHNPLLDVEFHETLLDTLSVKQKCKLRKAKLNKTNYGTRKTKPCPATDHLRDSTNKHKGNKQIKSKNISKNKIKSELIENASDVENVGTQQVASVLTESEKEKLVPANVNDLKKGTAEESLLAAEEKSNIKVNSRSKAVRNEKDKFLAEHFKIVCFLCDVPFETFCNVLKHFEEQHKQRGYIQCCDKKFYRRNVLIDHVNFHLNPNYFKCNQCDKVMEDRRRLELHCKSHEINNGKHFCCDTCGKGFIKLAMLNSHKKIHLSEEEKRFRCHECGKKFASNYMLTNHCRTTHLKLYHKICEICGKSIQDKTIFERHMLQHEGKSAPSASCDICGLLLTDEKALERHKKVIHPENGQKIYTCSICSKISPNLRTHKLHVRFTHESGYNYKCTICEKAFKRPQPLKEHMASHTGEILYTCPWCPKTFNSNANMHNHRKKVHPKEWEETSRKRYSGKLPPRFKPPTTIEHNDLITS